MKKLKLEPQKFSGAEVLSRAQLKKVMGGSGSGKCSKEGDYCVAVAGGGGSVHGKCVMDAVAKVFICEAI